MGLPASVGMPSAVLTCVCVSSVHASPGAADTDELRTKPASAIADASIAEKNENERFVMGGYSMRVFGPVCATMRPRFLAYESTDCRCVRCAVDRGRRTARGASLLCRGVRREQARHAARLGHSRRVDQSARALLHRRQG